MTLTVTEAEGAEDAHIEEETGVEPGLVLFSTLLSASPSWLEEVHED